VYDNTDMDGMTMLDSYLEKIVCDYPENSLFIMGDFNARMKTFLDYIPDDNLDHIIEDAEGYPTDIFNLPRSSMDSEFYNNYGKKLAELCCAYNIHALNGRIFQDMQGNYTCVTHNGASVVDYMLASSELFHSFNDFGVHHRDESIHFPLFCSLDIDIDWDNTIHSTEDTEAEEAPIKYDKYIWRESQVGTFLINFQDEFFNKHDELLCVADSNIEKSLEMFTDIYHKAAAFTKSRLKGTKGKVMSEQSQPPWWDQELEDIKHQKYIALRSHRDFGLDIGVFRAKRALFKKTFTVKKLKYLELKRQQLVDCRHNPKLFWNTLKSNRKKSTKVTNTISAKGWFQHFKGLLQHEYCPDYNNILETDDTVPDNIELQHSTEDINKPLSEKEIYDSLCSLKNNKSPGEDGLSSEFLKSTRQYITSTLTKLFNKVYEMGVFPQQWGKSIICPLFKAGDKNNTGNYRGISLINSICKVFTSVINTRLQTWCDINSAIHETQAGFRPGYSTVDQVFILQAMTQKYLSKRNGRFYCLYIDFSKAFDCINHDVLLNHLKTIGLRGNILKILSSMYSRLSASVKTGTGLSNYFSCNMGTRQGCILSPKLFILFINQLVSLLEENGGTGIFISTDIPDVYALLFADDVSTIANSTLQLQKKINVLENFCETTGMKINLQKTKIMVFRNGGTLRHYEKWYFKGEKLEVVNQYRYLGIMFTPKLSWTKAQNCLASQARKAILCIYQYQQKFGFFSHRDMFKLYDSMVVPILCYGAEVWGTSYSKATETAHTLFCKRFLKLSKSTPNNMILGECGKTHLQLVYMFKSIKYWCRLIHLGSSRLPNQAYRMIKSASDAGRQTWATDIKTILFRLGFGNVWIQQEIGDSDCFLAIFKQRLRDNLVQDWQSSLHTNSKCSTYKHYKSMLDVEKYLSFDLPLHLRTSLAKFRCNNFNLLIETGRHNNIPRNERLCTFCLKKNISAIEDEYHLLLCCHHYSELRNIYINPYYYTFPSIAKFTQLMQSHLKVEIYNVSIFLYKVSNIRKSIIQHV